MKPNLIPTLSGLALVIGGIAAIGVDMQMYDSAHGGYLIAAVAAGWSLTHLCVEANWGKTYKTLGSFILGGGGFGLMLGLSMGTAMRLLNTGFAPAHVLDALLRIVLISAGFAAPYLATVYPRSKPLLTLKVKDE